MFSEPTTKKTSKDFGEINRREMIYLKRWQYSQDSILNGIPHSTLAYYSSEHLRKAAIINLKLMMVIVSLFA